VPDDSNPKEGSQPGATSVAARSRTATLVDAARRRASSILAKYADGEAVQHDELVAALGLTPEFFANHAHANAISQHRILTEKILADGEAMAQLEKEFDAARSRTAALLAKGADGEAEQHEELAAHRALTQEFPADGPLSQHLPLTAKLLAIASGEAQQAMPTTRLIAPAQAGCYKLVVESTLGFKIGQQVIVDPGTSVEEINTIAGFGSIILQLPLKFNHDVGAIVSATQAVTDNLSANCASSDTQQQLRLMDAQPAHGSRKQVVVADVNGPSTVWTWPTAKTAEHIVEQNEQNCKGLEAELKRLQESRAQRAQRAAALTTEALRDLQHTASAVSLSSAVSAPLLTDGDSLAYSNTPYSLPSCHAAREHYEKPKLVYGMPELPRPSSMPELLRPESIAAPTELIAAPPCVAYGSSQHPGPSRLRVLPPPKLLDDHQTQDRTAGSVRWPLNASAKPRQSPECPLSAHRILENQGSPKQALNTSFSSSCTSLQPGIDYIPSLIRGLPDLPMPTADLSWAMGPHETCNYLLPGILLVGSYPGAAADTWHNEKLASLMAAGVDSFVCLQELWELRAQCPPYIHLTHVLAEQRNWLSASKGSPPEHWHCPIPDQSVTTLERLEAAVATIVDRLLAGRRLYLHSWGGHGRVGTVACALLVKAYGMSAEEAQDYFMATQSTRGAYNIFSPGCWPHSVEQFAQVKQLELSGRGLSDQRLPRIFVESSFESSAEDRDAKMTAALFLVGDEALFPLARAAKMTAAVGRWC
jgi:hypothetical protein